MPNILIADDHDLVRDTIAAYLETVDDFKVMTAPTLQAALEKMEGIDSIDLLILDYHMPGMNGLEGLNRALKSYPATKVALMSGVANREVANRAMAQGAHGFIPKSLTPSSLINAIRFVLSGERYLPFDFAAPETAATADNTSNLSEREMQTLEQLCIGLSNKEIARNLGIQEVTVKLHVKNLLAKLGVSNRTQAALLAKERHLC
ncbi:response regulator transcription factor [Cognatiyoonia sp. IB215182]|uniref:response regulator transcription factor n=1 Tax=Cognatiyoonia sp. IB215182 TaxID=3097353 RepID=UPI002A0B2B34|nr:response regulator transcription factor [Cognatiyoonia sp. IB215182]MDX8355315.1 response regulator transcription factor [Cognatiyoonia sp. IB215182]